MKSKAVAPCVFPSVPVLGWRLIFKAEAYFHGGVGKIADIHFGLAAVVAVLDSEASGPECFSSLNPNRQIVRCS